jgi:autotransporter-associated beta strand protein
MKNPRSAHRFILLGSIASSLVASQAIADSGIVFISPSADTRIFNAPWGVDLNEGAGTSMGIYQSRDRSLLRFDFGLLPAGSSTTSAALSVVATDLFGGNANAESMNIFRLTQAWTEGGVTWNRYDGVTSWATPGGDFDATVYASSTANPGTGQAAVWDVTSLTQGWLSNSFANNGLMIINSGTTNGLHFGTREQSNAASRPSLKMTISTASTPAPGAWVWNGGAGGAGPVDGAGTWTGASSWWNGAAATWADGNDAVFGAGNGTAGTVTLSGTVAPKSIWFEATGGGNYTLDGGTIDLTGGVRAFHTSVNATINSTITNGVLFKQGSGTLTVNGANTHSGGTTIAGGILKAGSSNALGANSSFISVSAGASLDINGQTLQDYTQNIHIAGAGADPALGALGNSGTNNLNAIRGITLTGDASVGANGRWDIGRLDFNGDPSNTVNHIDGGGFVLTKVGPGDLGILSGATNLAGFIVAEGRALPHENTSFGAGPVTVQSGGTVRPWGGTTFANNFNLGGGIVAQEEGFTDTYSGNFNVTAASTTGQSQEAATS